MRLVDFLTELLRAQAETLETLGNVFGNDILLEILEAAGETSPELNLSGISNKWFVPSLSDSHSPYAELQGSVQEFKLHPPFEFHLWAYPSYRKWIESSIDLNSSINGQIPGILENLIDLTLTEFNQWFKNLNIPEQFIPRLESLVHPIWIKFRSRVLKKSGKRSMGIVTQVRDNRVKK
jgi:hypothetical protein